MAIYGVGTAEYHHKTPMAQPSESTQNKHISSGLCWKFSGVTQVQLSYTIPLVIHTAQN